MNTQTFQLLNTIWTVVSIVIVAYLIFSEMRRIQYVKSLEASNDELANECDGLEKELSRFDNITAREIELSNERAKQVGLGYDAKHDDQHVRGELVQAGVSLALDYYATVSSGPFAGLPYPWPNKPTGDFQHILVVAAAFLLAEAERLDRIEAGESDYDV